MNYIKSSKFEISEKVDVDTPYGCKEVGSSIVHKYYHENVIVEINGTSVGAMYTGWSYQTSQSLVDSPEHWIMEKYIYKHNGKEDEAAKEFIRSLDLTKLIRDNPSVSVKGAEPAID